MQLHLPDQQRPTPSLCTCTCMYMLQCDTCLVRGQSGNLKALAQTSVRQASTNITAPTLQDSTIAFNQFVLVVAEADGGGSGQA